MNIIHVTQFFHPARGYQENHLSILQVKDGHKVTIICTDNLSLWGVTDNEMQKLDKKFSEKYNVKILRLHKFLEFSTRIFVMGLKKALYKENPELLIIHAVSLPMSLQAMKWGAKNNVRMIVDDHMVEAGSFNRFAKYFYKIFHKVFPVYLKLFNIKIAKWIAVCDETKKFMLDNYGITDHITVVPLGYNDNNIFRDIRAGRKWLKENALPENAPYILYIGKFDNMKDPIDLLEPFNIFLKNHQKYRLLMVGDPAPEYANKIENKIVELHLEDKVFIRKSIANDQMRKVFSFAQMTIWPHGSSMAMLEAMACKCPVIAPNLNVNLERLSGGRGMVFEENNNLDLTDKMEQLLKNKEQIVVAAELWVLQYSWRKIACDFIK